MKAGHLKGVRGNKGQNDVLVDWCGMEEKLKVCAWVQPLRNSE